MHHGLRLDGEGTSETTLTIEVGTHTHKVQRCKPYLLDGKRMDYRSIQEPCLICERENQALVDMTDYRGGFYVEERMHKLESYRAYNQRWPFDARKMVLSVEVVFDEKEKEVYVDGYNPRTMLEELMDTEAVAELLEELSGDERMVIQLTAEGYKPREIAVVRGELTSARTRQLKYAGLRILGAPINERMRRTPKHDK